MLTVGLLTISGMGLGGSTGVGVVAIAVCWLLAGLTFHVISEMLSRQEFQD
jgi:hypothetical protein